MSTTKKLSIDSNIDYANLFSYESLVEKGLVNSKTTEEILYFYDINTISILKEQQFYIYNRHKDINLGGYSPSIINRKYGLTDVGETIILNFFTHLFNPLKDLDPELFNSQIKTESESDKYKNKLYVLANLFIKDVEIIIRNGYDINRCFVYNNLYFNKDYERADRVTFASYFIFKFIDLLLNCDMSNLAIFVNTIDVMYKIVENLMKYDIYYQKILNFPNNTESSIPCYILLKIIEINKHIQKYTSIYSIEHLNETYVFESIDDYKYFKIFNVLYKLASKLMDIKYIEESEAHNVLNKNQIKFNDIIYNNMFPLIVRRNLYHKHKNILQ